MILLRLLAYMFMPKFKLILVENKGTSWVVTAKVYGFTQVWVSSDNAKYFYSDSSPGQVDSKCDESLYLLLFGSIKRYYVEREVRKLSEPTKAKALLN